MSDRRETTSSPVSELGEDALVARIAQRIGAAPAGETWAGDDAAAFPVDSGTLVSTTDLMVEGIDFDLAYCDGADVGWKLVACNASDVAAMGAAPTRAVATLMLPASTPIRLVDDFLDGLTEAASLWGIGLVGGDLSSGPVIAASVALLGRPFDLPTLRSGARPGDAICVTGTFGGAAGGLIALRAGAVDRAAVAAEIRTPTGADGLAVLAVRQLRPRARLEEARLLSTFPPRAAIDVSDGLAIDLHRLLSSSGAGCEVDPAAVPVDPELRFLAEYVPGAPDPLELALAGGEDYELLVTLDPALVEAAQVMLDETGVGLTRIGEVTDGPCRIGDEPLERWSEVGWDHLRTP
ncbi:MAG TPA: thiamine-phosphate kinase [Actinomycetota bacterium]|nr:thiamine-phosphate kinase [Actinomycetota bacterium]